MEKKVLDLVLVPCGLLAMVAYHLWLLQKVVRQPTKTVIGVNAFNRRLWVQAMMEDGMKNGVLAVQSLRNNIMASTLLASTAIMLSSLIAVLMTSGGVLMTSGGGAAGFDGSYHGGGFNGRNPATMTVISEVFGDRSELCLSLKFFSILVCFLLAFLLNVQSIRYYSHASILINVPFKKLSTSLRHQMLTAEYVATTVNRGSYFWSLGLRAFYFSFPLFMWIFGPIPMFVSTFVLIFILYFLDFTFECGWTGISDHSCDDVENGDHNHNGDIEIGKPN
ncbi:hypothetical protein HN51_050633 [Arachis hypogaea]|uniref:uncharacterized protein LOC107610110 n=1 Tax=Arachis ipaensis TaxID=130454 RepID=UPI0007AFA019|nr:uncharacterized protein LOC107610110 [Arachis ipaensis]XP_025668273.1 uncharacterized protein LOC112766588 [Arachis hypogaea]